MPDPAEIIAEIILKPPPQAGVYNENFQYQYEMMMALPMAPDLVRHIAGAAIQALTGAGWTLVPLPAPDGTLPSSKQIRSWLVCHDWKAVSDGPAGTVWFPPVPHAKGVGIPDDNDPVLISGAIQRIANRTRMPAMSPEQVLAEMLTYAGE